MRNPIRQAMLAVSILAIMAGSAVAETEQEATARAVALEMVDAWNVLDVGKIVDLFAEDGVLHSVMIEPITGRAALRDHLAKLLEGATRLELQLQNVAVTGNVVFLERIDDFDYKGKHGRLPVVGVLFIEDGKVALWREYYDRAGLLAEMGLVAPATDGADTAH